MWGQIQNGTENFEYYEDQIEKTEKCCLEIF